MEYSRGGAFCSVRNKWAWFNSDVKVTVHIPVNCST